MIIMIMIIPPMIFMGGLGNSTSHCLFSQLTKKTIISKHRMLSFALRTCLVPIKLNYYQYKLFPFLAERFLAFSGRIKSRDVICKRLAYKMRRFTNLYVCLNFTILEPWEIYHPLTFWAKELTDPVP